MMHIMRPLGHPAAGDQVIDMVTEQDLAKDLFKKAMEAGSMAYVKQAGGPVQIFSLDEVSPQDTVIVTPALVGG